MALLANHWIPIPQWQPSHKHSEKNTHNVTTLIQWCLRQPKIQCWGQIGHQRKKLKQQNSQIKWSFNDFIITGILIKNLDKSALSYEASSYALSFYFHHYYDHLNKPIKSKKSYPLLYSYYTMWRLKWLIDQRWKFDTGFLFNISTWSLQGHRNCGIFQSPYSYLSFTASQRTYILSAPSLSLILRRCEVFCSTSSMTVDVFTYACLVLKSNKCDKITQVATYITGEELSKSKVKARHCRTL